MLGILSRARICWFGLAGYSVSALPQLGARIKTRRREHSLRRAEVILHLHYLSYFSRSEAIHVANSSESAFIKLSSSLRSLASILASHPSP